MSKLKRIVGILLLTALLALPLSACGKEEPHTQCDAETYVKYFLNEGGTPYLQKFHTADDTPCDASPLNIVTLTDLHLYGDNETKESLTLGIIDNILKKGGVDLVIITGDVCLSDNAQAMITKLSAVFTKYKTFWAVTTGNHEAEGASYSRKDLMDMYIACDEYCLTRNETDDSTVYGYGNQVINYRNSTGAIVQSMILMDSGDYVTAAEAAQFNTPAGEYAFVKANQIDWYTARIAKLKEENGGNAVKSLLFMHIPFPEMAKINENPEATVHYGMLREAVCCSKYNSGMFDAVVAAGSTQAVYFGHDHINDICATLKGVKLVYSQSLSFGSYYYRESSACKLLALTDKNKDVIHYADGYTLTVVGIDGNITITPKYNEYEGTFDGLEEYLEELGIIGTYKTTYAK